MWTEQAKKEWKKGLSDSNFNSTEQVRMYQMVENWVGAINKATTKRFALSPDARIWCEVTAEAHTVKRVIWNGS